MAAVQQAHLNFAAPCFVGFWGAVLLLLLPEDVLRCCTCSDRSWETAMTPFRDRESPSPTRFRIQERAAARAESLAAFEVQTRGSPSSTVDDINPALP